MKENIKKEAISVLVFVLVFCLFFSALSHINKGPLWTESLGTYNSNQLLFQGWADITEVVSIGLSLVFCAAAGFLLIRDSGFRWRVFLPATLLGSILLSYSQSQFFGIHLYNKWVSSVMFLATADPVYFSIEVDRFVQLSAFVVVCALLLSGEKPLRTFWQAAVSWGLSFLAWFSALAFCQHTISPISRLAASDGLKVKVPEAIAGGFFFGLPYRGWILLALCAIAGVSAVSIVLFRMNRKEAEKPAHKPSLLKNPNRFEKGGPEA